MCYANSKRPKAAASKCSCAIACRKPIYVSDTFEPTASELCWIVGTSSNPTILWCIKLSILDWDMCNHVRACKLHLPEAATSSLYSGEAQSHCVQAMFVKLFACHCEYPQDSAWLSARVSALIDLKCVVLNKLVMDPCKQSCKIFLLRVTSTASCHGAAIMRCALCNTFAAHHTYAGTPNMRKKWFVGEMVSRHLNQISFTWPQYFLDIRCVQFIIQLKKNKIKILNPKP